MIVHGSNSNSNHKNKKNMFYYTDDETYLYYDTSVNIVGGTLANAISNSR